MARAPGGRIFTRVHAALLRRRRPGLASRWFGTDLVLIEVRGRRTGVLRRTAVVGVPFRGGGIVVSANAGLDRRPAWAYNLDAATGAVVYDRGRRCEVTVERVREDCAAPLWNDYLGSVPAVAHYQRMARRDFDMFVMRTVDGV
jgi:deazaflavin-dependent oxidoreductase (nitroreductase family)